MSSTTIKTSDIQIPVYRKLPPIQTPSAMPGRQVMSPSMVTVDFGSNGITSKPVTGKQSVRMPTSNSSKPTTKSTNQIAPKSPSANKPKSSGDVALNDSPKGIELVGFKFNHDKAGMEDVTNSANKPETNGWTPLSTELPPCKICGDKASGLHYGVNTCEACKAFFRRTLKKAKVDFTCSCTKEEKKLGIEFPRKFSCAKCRYERCIKVGMSKDAIKIGRYTITRKRQNDREVKSLKAGSRNGDGRKLSESSSKSSSSLSPYSTGQSVSSPEELSSDITSLSLQSAMKTQTARKRRHDDDNDPEDGFLYRSLTNSIILSLLENQKTSAEVPSPETIPVDLVMNYQEMPGDEPSAVERLLNDETHANQVPESSLEDLLSSAPEITNENYGDHLLVTAGSTDDSLDQTPIEKLLMNGTTHAPNVPLNVESLDLVPDSGVDILGEIDEKLTFYHDQEQSLHSMNQFKADVKDDLSPPVTFEVSTSNSVKESPIETMLKGNNAVQLPDLKPSSVKPSPIEKLLMTPVNLKPPTNHVDAADLTSSLNMPTDLKQEIVNGSVTQTDDIKSNTLNDDKTVILYGVNSGVPINTKPENCEDNVLIATKLDPAFNEPFAVANDYIKQDLEEDVFTAENVDDLEIQIQQLNRFENPALVVGQGLSLEQAHKIVSTLVMAASVLFDKPKLSCEEIKKRHAEYLEQYTLKKQVFGDMSNISKEEYLDFYNQTGIEIDNRQQILIEALKFIEDMISKLVKFAKFIPGFSELDIDDQVNLVKVSRFDFQMIKIPKIGGCMRTGSRVATTPWNKDYHLEELTKIYPLAHLETKMNFVTEVHRLHLTEEECVILKGIVITYPASRFEHGMIQFRALEKCIQSSLNIATLPWNKEYHLEEIHKIFPEEYCSIKIGHVADVLALNLTFQETIILKSIVITFPDRCVLKDPHKVEQIHDHLIACFLHLLSKRPPEKTISVRTIMKLLFKLRDLSVWDNQIVLELFEVWPASSNHQLVKEVVS